MVNFLSENQDSDYGASQRKLKELKQSIEQPASFIKDEFYVSLFSKFFLKIGSLYLKWNISDSPDFDYFSPLNAIIENFPDLKYSDSNYETNDDFTPSFVNDIGNNDEENTNNIIGDDQVNIVLSFTAQNSDELVTNVAQVASADVPNQDTPENYVNTDRDTLFRVIDNPVYYKDTNIFKI